MGIVKLQTETAVFTWTESTKIKNMKTVMNVPVKTIGVPLDILMDILRILMENNVPNRIKAVSGKENILWLDVKLPPDHPYRKEIASNINALLDDYQIYVNGSPDNMDFSAGRESDF